MTVFVSRERPADYAEVAARLTARELRTHYKASSTTIAIWNAQVGRVPKPRYIYQPRSLPADFAQYADLKSYELCERYSAHPSVIRRWRAEIGYVAKPKAEDKPAQKPAPVAPAYASNRFAGVGAPTPFHRDMSQAGQAADYLRQFGAVWRCTETGRPDHKGKFWRRGHAVLSDAEIIERADWMRNRREAA